MDKFCLKWNDFQSSVTTSFWKIRNEEDFCDVTLVSDDQVSIKAHKLVLSTSSSFFEHILRKNHHQHPLLYLSGINSTDLNFVLDYIYQGEVQLFQEQLDSFLNVAQMLKIEGLLSRDDEMAGDTVDKKDFSPEADIKPTRSFTEAHRRDSDEQEAFKENVGIVTTIDTTDKNEIKAKVKELSEKIDGIYVCKVCQKSSSHHHTLLRHIETHIEGLSYSCQHCEKTFRSVNSLTSHKSLNHKSVKL